MAVVTVLEPAVCFEAAQIGCGCRDTFGTDFQFLGFQLFLKTTFFRFSAFSKNNAKMTPWGWARLSKIFILVRDKSGARTQARAFPLVLI